MPEKNVKTVCITITPVEAEIVDKLRRKHYKLNQSEVYRLLINEGAKNLLGKKEAPTTN